MQIGQMKGASALITKNKRHMLEEHLKGEIDMHNEPITIGKQTNFPLNGLVALPDDDKTTEKRIPAVVFVHGSGSSNMDEKVLKLTPFKDLACGLAEHGIASIRYDKRSFAHGRKMLKIKEPITVKQETIEDAVMAAELLRQDDRIDAERIFVLGHSMGGMLAPRIDVEGGNFRGLILLAGSPRRLEDIFVEQTREIMEGMNPILKFLAGGQVKKLAKKVEGIYELTDEEAKASKFSRGTTLYYFKEMGEHAAENYLRETKKPILIMQGSKDFQVKVDKDFRAYQEILQHHPDVTFKLYEGLNHCFVPSVYGELSEAKREYSVEQHIGEDVILDIAEWIHQR